MIRVLRPTGALTFASAAVFDRLFVKHIGSVASVEIVQLEDWLADVFGPIGDGHSRAEAAQALARVTQGFDFLCPGAACIALAPALLALRNEARLDLRLLFISHAPGVYLLQWALFRKLLAPGDVIVAPSQSCRAAILFMAPELEPFVRVINHPMEPLRSSGAGLRCNPRRVVSLVSIHETKLVHRQIDAMALLREQGFADLTMDIAGQWEETRTGRVTPYVRSLHQRIQRLGLENTVRLVGLVMDDTERRAFLTDAGLLVGLSVSLEESFGKAAVEALGMGLPVVATRWNGFPEVVGEAGVLVPVRFGSRRPDVAVADVASAVRKMVEEPPSIQVCLEQADKFLPSVSARGYREALEDAMAQKPSARVGGRRKTTSTRTVPEGTRRGLLGATAILQAFPHDLLIDMALENCDRVREGWKGTTPGKATRMAIIEDTLALSIRRLLERFFAHPKAGLAIPDLSRRRRLAAGKVTGRAAAGTPGVMPGDPFAVRIAGAVLSRSTAHSKEACLLALHSLGATDLVRQCLPHLAESPVANYLGIELELRTGSPELALARFLRSHGRRLLGEGDASSLRQLARLARSVGEPALAVVPLTRWLGRYPDNIDSAPLWLELAVNAMGSGTSRLPLAERAVERAEATLGPIPEVVASRERLLHLQAASAFQ